MKKYLSKTIVQEDIIPSTKLVFVKENQVYLKKGIEVDLSGHTDEWLAINFYWAPVFKF